MNPELSSGSSFGQLAPQTFFEPFIAVLVSIVFSNSFAQDYSSYYRSINKGDWALGYKKGAIQPSSYVQLYDNIPALHYEIQKMQYYGQDISRSTKTFVPIWDIKNVDKRRAEIGLPSLYEYAQTKNVELPKDYPIPPEYVKE